MVPLKYNFARKASHDYVWKSLEKKMQHNRKYRNLGWWAAHWLFYNLGRIQNDGNLNDGFWLIQKLDCFANKLKNPRILWRKLFVLGSLGYNHLTKMDLFSFFSALCSGWSRNWIALGISLKILEFDVENYLCLGPWATFIYIEYIFCAF